jgi:hypothetical protein
MDAQFLFNLAVAIAGVMVGWIFRVIWAEVKLLQSTQREIEENLVINYVRRDDWKDAMNRIENMFQRIFDKLDSKEDKK